MTDTYGAKVSQRGFDALTCSDDQLLFNSEWQNLKIYKQGSFTITSATTGVEQVIAETYLSYAPAFIIMVDNSWGLPGRQVLNSQDYTIGINASNELVFVTTYPSHYFLPVHGYYYIFYYDIDSTYEANNINLTPATPSIVEKYGIKVSLPGKDTSSTDYRDFAVNSDCSTLIIHKSGHFTYSTNDGSNISIPHGLDYPPLVWTYWKGRYGGGTVTYLHGIGGTTIINTNVDSTNINFTLSVPSGSPDLYIRYLVFKDRFR